MYIYIYIYIYIYYIYYIYIYQIISVELCCIIHVFPQWHGSINWPILSRDLWKVRIHHVRILGKVLAELNANQAHPSRDWKNDRNDRETFPERGIGWIGWIGWTRCGRFPLFFPTCQVTVVRFYQSCSSPSPSPPPPSPPPPPPPSPPASPPPPLHPLPCSLPPCQLFAKLFANFRTQWALLDLNCKGLSALGTAGPQPGTFRAQWAPLDLNLGRSELSEHRWTSTWDPPSSVSTAGPQPGTLRAHWAPLDLNGQIECQKICQIERQIECQKECQKIRYAR